MNLRGATSGGPAPRSGWTMIEKLGTRKLRPKQLPQDLADYNRDQRIRRVSNEETTYNRTSKIGCLIRMSAEEQSTHNTEQLWDVRTRVDMIQVFLQATSYRDEQCCSRAACIDSGGVLLCDCHCWRIPIRILLMRFVTFGHKSVPSLSGKALV